MIIYGVLFIFFLASQVRSVEENSIPRFLKIKLKFFYDLPWLVAGDTYIRGRLSEIAEDMVRETQSQYFDNVDQLNVSITLELVGVKPLLSKVTLTTTKAGDLRYYRNFCRWQRLKRRIKGHRYFSVLLTGIPLHKNMSLFDERVDRRESYTYRGAACQQSCTVIQYRWPERSFALARTIAFSLGMNLDGPPNNNCSDPKGVLAQRGADVEYPNEWSKCNANDLEAFLRSGKGSCLRCDDAVPVEERCQAYIDYGNLTNFKVIAAKINYTKYLNKLYYEY